LHEETKRNKLQPVVTNTQSEKGLIIMQCKGVEVFSLFPTHSLSLTHY